ncbi:MAG: YegS/Rv2252/BmrU family lipid kinase [Candidatus Latescibacterota bacterium]
MRVLIVANPLVGIDKEKRKVVDGIISHIRKNGGNADITYILKPDLGKKHSSRAALEGYDAVYAAGGDGTVNDVASGLIGNKLPMGIIPLGTGNGLARSLGIPFDMDGLVKMFDANKTLTIDTGKIGSHIFVSTAGIGFDANISLDFNKKKRSQRSVLSYFILAVKNYFTKRTEKVVFQINGKEFTRNIFALTISNAPQYGAGAVIAPQANPSNGKLIAVIIPKISIFKAPDAIKRLFEGSVQKIKELEYFEFKSLRIQREQQGIYHVDGEVFSGEATLQVTVHPSSLKVIVP